MKQRAKIWTALLLAASLLAGCGGKTNTDAPAPDDEPGGSSLIGSEVVAREPADSVFSLNFDAEAGTNPVRADSSTNMLFWSLLYDSVFTVDENFELSSDIVLETKSDDYIWWVFDIRTDVCFSDGTPMTAKDVVYSIQRAAQTSYYKERLACIYGISALGDATFAITTSEANSQFPKMLNIPIIKNGDYFEDYPLGTGPYMLNEDRSALVKNPESRLKNELPVDTVYLRSYPDTSTKITAFEDASIDLVTNDPTGMYNLGYGSSNETRFYDTSNLHYLGFNMRSMFFQMFRMRYAMSWAVDRETIIADYLDGCAVATALPVHPKSALFDAELDKSFRFDAAKSAAMFEAAGVSDLDADGDLEVLVTGIVVEMNVRFIVNNDSTAKVLAARHIAEQLNSMGITTTLYELSWDDYMTALETGDYDMYYGELRLTPDWDLSYLFEPRDQKTRESDEKNETFTGRNYASCADTQYGELYAAYLAAAEPDRAEAFAAVLKYVAESAAIVPICFERREVLTHRGVVTGVNATQYDVFHNFTEWTIDLT